MFVKKLISIILAICIVMAIIPFSAYIANITPEITLDDFTNKLQELQIKYDNNSVHEITIENDKELYRIDGEEFPVSEEYDKTATVTKDDFEIPLSAIAPHVELSESSTYSITDVGYNDIIVDKKTAEALGFEVEIKDDKAVLTQPYQTKRLIVKSKYDINPLDSVSIVEGYDDLHIVQFDNQESTKQAEEYYNNQKLIEYVEPDLIMSTLEYYYNSNDILQDSDVLTNYDNHLSWGSEAIGVDDYIDYLDKSMELPEIVVGIIDTGVDIDHKFLKDRVIETGFNISSTGTVNGEDDDNGHGSHVAGIIADNSTNNVKIKGYKVLNSDGNGTTSAIITAIERAISDNVNVINMSLGGRGKSELMEQTVSKAIQNDITICVAAGNEGDFAKNHTPANIEECITVAAIDADNKKPYWSNFGEIVDIVAPGVSIYSTYKNNTYETLSGTSMACPFVTAAAAMILSKNISYNPAELCDILVDSGRDWIHSSVSNGLMHTKCVYLGNIDNYKSERTATPKANYSSGKYVDSVMVELTCDTENAEIYYTLDGSRASWDNGILYTEPIVIDRVTKLHAVAYSSNKLKSLQIVNNYYICYLDDELNFEISSEGIITKYSGNNKYLTIPDKIQNINVTGIGSSVFFNTDLTMIKLPDTCTYIGSSAFNFCKKLCYVEANNLTEIGNRAFFMCRALNEINLEHLKKLSSEAFMATSLISAKADKLEVIPKSAFCNCYAMYFDFSNVKTIEGSAFSGCLKLEAIKIPNAENISSQAFSGCRKLEKLYTPYVKTIGVSAFFSCTNLEAIEITNSENISSQAFSGCRKLEELYIPNVKTIGENALNDCSSIKIIFAPKLEITKSLPDYDDVNIYLTDKCFELPVAGYKYNIIAPTGSYAEQYTKENEHSFIPSEELRFDSIAGEDFVYSTSDGKTCSMPIDIVEQMWYDYLPINRQSDFMTHEYLIDVVNDNFINGKDFAKIHHTAKYGW